MLTYWCSLKSLAIYYLLENRVDLGIKTCLNIFNIVKNISHFFSLGFELNNSSTLGYFYSFFFLISISNPEAKGFLPLTLVKFIVQPIPVQSTHTFICTHINAS